MAGPTSAAGVGFTEPARAEAGWLAWREPADAAARAADLVDVVRSQVAGGPLVVHDLGCGTGSMARWLAPRLPGRQRWVLHDRDADLLLRATAPVPFETRRDDITRLDAADLAEASLITASALLDMMTGPGLDRLVAACAGPGCPVLVALSVTGRVELDPPDPLDGRVGAAFNDHQRRPAAEGRRLGPDAHAAAVAGFTRLGRAVAVRSTPWRLGPEHRELMAAWFDGWLGAAREQDPSLVGTTTAYAARRRALIGAGELRGTVDHRDLLVHAS